MADPQALANGLVRWGLMIKGIEDDYARKIGRMSLKWNLLHGYLFLCFECAIPIAPEIVKSLWEVESTDKKQRDMLESVLPAIKNEEDRSALVWVSAAANNLSQYRNTLIHSMVVMNYSKLKMEVFPRATHPKHVLRSQAIETKDTYEKIISDLDELSGYTEAIIMNLADPSKRRPLPKRPTLKIAHVAPEKQ